MAAGNSSAYCYKYIAWCSSITIGNDTDGDGEHEEHEAHWHKAVTSPELYDLGQDPFELHDK